ncbi:CsbD family protein [Skermania sp. ID1734]|uniref:CsbD family protein n=1 Tax=Skermania sp. ID1734 TaxID=2597516 RepID=UPI002106B42D|nr:CsbD family protein [Skermania sp. ID1734]
MSAFSDKAEEFKGRAKEAAGDVAGDSDLKSEGKTDQASSNVKQKIGDVADKAKDAADSVRDKLSGN